MKLADDHPATAAEMAALNFELLTPAEMAELQLPRIEEHQAYLTMLLP